LPRPYIDIWEEQRIHPKAYQNAPQFFEITEAGVAALEEHGFVLPPRFPASHPRHHIMSDQGVLSFKIGLKHHPEIEYIGPAAIHKSKHTPAKTRDSKTWYRFPYAARGKSHTACPDYFPIGFRRPHDPDVPIFLALEFDTGSERIPSYEYDHSRITTKMLAWVDVLKNETEYRHLGLPNLYITWVCSTEHRKRSLMAMVDTVVPKRLLPYFLFTTFALYDAAIPPVADGRLLEADYDRAVSAPFNILTS
jgi:hypothetical protein